MEKTAVGYIRVSTSRQAKEGVSLAAQEQKIRTWADLNSVAKVLIFRDEGMSGGKANNRPGLQKALAAMGKGDALVVYSLSRLSRSTVDTMNIAKTLERRKVDLVSLSEKIDTTSAAGKMIFRLLAVLGEFERDQISERTLSVLAYKRSKGERLGGNYPPFGHKFEGKMLVPEPNEQATIRQIRNWRRKGFSLMEIAKKLEVQGIQRKAGGRTWNKTSVFRVTTRTI